MKIFGQGCKKGNSPLDVITIVLVITVFAIFSIIGLQIFDGVNSDIQSNNDLNAASKEISSDLYSKYPTTLDSAILMAFVLLLIFVIASVFMLDTHPIFFIISVLLLVIILIVTALIGNVYDDLMLDDDLSLYANQFTYTGWVMGHILELAIAVGFIVMIAMFIKFRG